jgi:hypothetical protein
MTDIDLVLYLSLHRWSKVSELASSWYKEGEGNKVININCDNTVRINTVNTLIKVPVNTLRYITNTEGKTGLACDIDGVYYFIEL